LKTISFRTLKAACLPAAVLVAILLVGLSFVSAALPDMTLQGDIRDSQNHTYVEVPFVVPAGVERLTVSFRYTGKEDHTTLDLGVEDPQRFRGWSGGNKSDFTIGAADATPSYLPGPVIPGRWKLLIGVANIRPQKIAHYTALIRFTRAGKSGVEGFAAGLNPAPLRTEARWYRGDLHMHTAHSDGSCTSQSGKNVPCPAFVTVESAVRRGLDFIAITDHNTVSQFDDERELQPYFDQLLFIPGREVTTFYGHSNFFGSTEYLDFRVGVPGHPSMNSLFQKAKALGELVSINHPIAPSGEACIGCGWTPKDFDMHLIDAVEAINGGNKLAHKVDIEFWESQLNAGYRPTAIGGSDTHRPELNTVGEPTTVVFAKELSVPSILEGIRRGHVFVDVTASRDRTLELEAFSGDHSATMGDTLVVPLGETLKISVHVTNCRDLHVRLVIDGKPAPVLASDVLTSLDQRLPGEWTSDGKRHWIRADVLDGGGQLQLLGNPIYLNAERFQ
jgi:hypothetical protein